MYRHCTTEKTAAQQRLFEQTLLKATAHESYNQISVSHLCELSGLSRKTFYRLFECKEDVLLSLIDHTLMDYMDFPGYSDNIGKDILNEPANLFAYWRQHKPLLDILDQTNKTSLLLDRTVLHIMQEQREVIQHFNVCGNPHARQILLFYFSGIMSLVIDWYRSGFAESEEEMAQLMNRLLYNAPVKQAKYISR